MSVVTLQAQDGRRALLAFTGLDALQSWQPDARPVPVTIDIAAQAARSEELTAVLIDVAGPHPFVIEGEVLGRAGCWSSARRAVRWRVRLDHPRSGLSALPVVTTAFDQRNTSSRPRVLTVGRDRATCGQCGPR